MATNPFLALASSVRRDVEARISGLLDSKIDAVRPLGGDVVVLAESVRDLTLRGGKRLRPALVVTGFRCANASAALEPALDAGAALELLHAYFLIHDDWMDGDNMRRGGPAVHVMLGKHYRSKRLGEHCSMLAGEIASAHATEALSRVDTSPARLARVFATFAQMQTDAVLGQQLDVVGRARDVERVYELKTASYTVKAALRIGALLGGGKPGLLTTLDRYAVPIGIAFQLRDDLLSVFGDPSQTGKPYGNDLKAGKRTVLITSALRRARGRDHRMLKKVVGNPKATDRQITQAVEILESCGARKAVEDRIAELHETSLAALKAGKLPASAQALLEGAARALTTRAS